MNRFATFAAAALAATGISLAPAPAAADSDDIAKIIAGLAVAGIIAKAIDDRNDRKRSATASDFGRFGDRNDHYYDGRRTIDGTIRPYHRDDRRKGPKFGRGYKKRALPERCLLRVKTSHGSHLAYGQRCLNRNYKFASKLPERCETVVRTRRGFRTVFGARCLRRDGWRVARR